jgi:hypothetical protein
MAQIFLKRAADAAGITLEQAEAFVCAIAQPSYLMAQAASDTPYLITTFSNPPNDMVGLTRGEFENTVVAKIWRTMAMAMLAPDDFADWPSTLWRHPQSNQAAPDSFTPAGKL